MTTFSDDIRPTAHLCTSARLSISLKASCNKILLLLSPVVSSVYLGLIVNSNNNKMLQTGDNIARELDNKGLSYEGVLLLIRVNITVYHGDPLRPDTQYYNVVLVLNMMNL